MKCKICQQEINMHIFGMPDDLCWGCANDQTKDQVVENQLDILKSKKDE